MTRDEKLWLATGLAIFAAGCGFLVAGQTPDGENLSPSASWLMTSAIPMLLLGAMIVAGAWDSVEWTWTRTWFSVGIGLGLGLVALLGAVVAERREWGVNLIAVLSLFGLAAGTDAWRRLLRPSREPVDRPVSSDQRRWAWLGAIGILVGLCSMIAVVVSGWADTPGEQAVAATLCMAAVQFGLVAFLCGRHNLKFTIREGTIVSAVSIGLAQFPMFMGSRTPRQTEPWLVPTVLWAAIVAALICVSIERWRRA